METSVLFAKGGKEPPRLNYVGRGARERVLLVHPQPRDFPVLIDFFSHSQHTSHRTPQPPFLTAKKVHRPKYSVPAVFVIPEVEDWR